MTTIHTWQLQQYTRNNYNNTLKTTTTIHETTTTIHSRQLQYTQDNYNNTHGQPTKIERVLCTGRPRTECDDTRCCIIQFWRPDDEHNSARNIFFSFVFFLYPNLGKKRKFNLRRRSAFILLVQSVVEKI